MTELLEKALAEMSRLSTEEQDAIAVLILDILEDDRQWENAFATSQDKLSKLAQKVRQDIQDGRVRKMGFDEL